MRNFESTIGVIGGGAAGSVAAEQLADAGFDVTVFDEHAGILEGTSRYAMAVHAGMEYVLSPSTAEECVDSAVEIRKVAPEACSTSPVHYIVDADSPVPLEKVVAFAEELRDYYANRDPSEYLLGDPNDFYRVLTPDKYPFMRPDRIAGGVVGQDVTFNMANVAHRLRGRFADLGVRTILEATVQGARELAQGGFELTYTDRDGTHTAQFGQIINTGGYRTTELDYDVAGDVQKYALNIKTFNLVRQRAGYEPVPSYAVVSGPYTTYYEYPGLGVSAMNAAGAEGGSVIMRTEVGGAMARAALAEVNQMMLSGEVPNARDRIESIFDFVQQYVPDVRDQFASVGLVPGIATSFKADAHARNQLGPRVLTDGWITAAMTKATHAWSQAAKIRALAEAGRADLRS